MTAETPSAPALQIGVSAQYTKDFSFESPHAPQIFSSLQTAPELTIGVNVHTKGVAEKTYEVALVLKLEAKQKEKTIFIAELTYAGIFVLPPMPEEQLKAYLLVECPRILFPFARSILANAVRDGGFPQIMVNPIDFSALYMANKNNIGVMPTAGAA